MWLIVKDGVAVATADQQPDVPDLESRGEFAVEGSAEQVGWHWNGAALEPPAIDIGAAKAMAKVRVSRRADEIAKMIAGTVPLAEQLSWPVKESAARAYAAGQATPSQLGLLAAEAAVAGETVAALAAKVIANADAYFKAAGLIAGQRRRTMAAIDALNNPATFDGDLANILAIAEIEAQDLLASLASH